MNNLVERLLSAIGQKCKRIIVVGDVLVDRWVHGHVEDCQDGCSKFVHGDVVQTPGGAANAENCLSNWGVKTTLCSYETSDAPIKCRYVEDGKIVFRIDDEKRPARRSGCQWGRDLALEMVNHADGVLLSDYDKGFLTPEFIQQVVGTCQRRNIPCVADCKRAPEVYAGCILKGNEEWFNWCHTHTHQFKVKGLIVTFGHRIPIVATNDKGGDSSESYDLLPVPCVNHVGAGDCFSSHLVLALTYGFSLKDAAALAHSAGRVYVQHAHNRPPTPAEIAADLVSVTNIDSPSQF